MRRITACTAALISFLFVFTSISASACDLSCWLQRSHDDCHSGATSAMAATMPMAMGSDQMQQMMAPGEPSTARLDGSMNMTPMSPQPEMVAEMVADPKMDSTALPDHSRRVSSCAHETCRQIWASSSPPGSRHAPPNFLHLAPVRLSMPTTLWTRNDCIKTGSPPPELHAGPLATILRI
jgi:hypothetical protein